MKRFLLTNDDGIDAPGLAALEQAVGEDAEIIVVAPAAPQSGSSHAVTTEGPIRLERLGENRYSVDASPADCVRAALFRFGERIDFVLAGINSGGNLGADVYHSGTVAAVREAVLRGVPGVAVSQYRNRELSAEDWARAARWARPMIAELAGKPAEPGLFWNVNLPCLEPGAPDPEVVVAALDPSPLPLSFREEGGLLYYNGVYHDRQRRPGSDVQVCFSGGIALTRIALFG